MNQEQLQSEVNRLKRELYELKMKYSELLKKYTKVSNEFITLKAGFPKKVDNDEVNS